MTTLGIAKEEVTFSSVEYLKNYDGDTVTVNLKGHHPLFGEAISIRVLGVDTPDRRTKNKCEKTLALRAKRFV